MRRTRVTAAGAVCALLMCAGGGERAGTSENPSSKPRRVWLEGAQLQVLKAQASRDGTPELAEQRRARYVADGLPAAAFEPEALRAAAIRATIDGLHRLPAAGRPLVVARAEMDYGISPGVLYSEIPRSTADLVGVFKRCVRSNSLEERQTLFRALEKEFLQPDQVTMLIDASASENTPQARETILDLLRSDWSVEGREYLYKRLLETEDVSTQKRILGILEGRHQISKEDHARLASRTQEPGLLEALFQVAESAWAVRRLEGLEFLLAEMGSGDPQHREMAIRSLTTGRGTQNPSTWDAIRRTIKAEKDSKVRASMVSSLAHLAGPSGADQFLLDVLASDDALEVRLAALEAVRLHAVGEHPDALQEADKLISILRRALGENPPRALSDALDKKVSESQQESKELREKRAQHKEKLRRIQENLKNHN